MRLSIRYTIYAVLFFYLAWLLSACGTLKPSPKPTSTPFPSLVPTFTPVPTPTLTVTPVPPLAVLLAPDGADQTLANRLQTDLNDIFTLAGLHLQVRGQLTPGDLTSSLKLVLALPPDPGIAQLAAAAPETQFLAIGIPGLEASTNLTLIGSPDERPDQQGFIAGVIAAMLSADWRVGAISLSDTAAGRAALNGFLNGVEYFCGLCRPAHPPFYEYPLYIELPSTSTSAEWQEAANYMADHDVETVYVYPAAGDESMLTNLANAGLDIISSGMPPSAARTRWALSLATDPMPLIKSQVQGLLDGTITGGRSLLVPIQFTEINSTLFTPGKQRLAGQILSDLQAGYIDTGVDLITGENRP